MAHCHPETRTVHERAAVLIWHYAFLQYADVLGLVHHSIDDVQTSNSTSRNAAADHNLQRVLHRQVQELRFEHFTRKRKPPHLRVASIADQDLLPHPTTLAGALPCPLDCLAPLDISHQQLLACLAAH